MEQYFFGNRTKSEQVQTAVEQRSVDKQLLLHIAAGRFICSIIERLLRICKARLAIPLNMRIRQHYSVHIFHAMARLDYPTWDDPSIRGQLESTHSNSRTSLAWSTVVLISRIISTTIQLLSQISVLFQVLKDQRDGPLLAILSFAHVLVQWRTERGVMSMHAGVWAATTKDSDYIRMEGLKRVVSDTSHRQEIVAGGMWEYLVTRKYKMTFPACAHA